MEIIKTSRSSKVTPDHIMISIYDDPSTTMAVTWRFDISVTDGYVEYRKDGDVEYKKVAAEAGEFKSEIEHTRMF